VRIVGVAGAIGSGKSELSRALTQIGGVRLSFGDFIRDEARRHELDPTRENLQQLGEQLIAELGAEEFVRRLLVERPPGELISRTVPRESPIAISSPAANGESSDRCPSP
jgi:dephospho-CoA kinase